jgi:hypothetical protein
MNKVEIIGKLIWRGHGFCREIFPPRPSGFYSLKPLALLQVGRTPKTVPAAQFPPDYPRNIGSFHLFPSGPISRSMKAL